MSKQETKREWYGRFRTHEKVHTEHFVLAPWAWALEAPPATLRWEKIEFTADNKRSVPNKSRGVYSFVLRPQVEGEPAGEYVFYIGKVGAPDNARHFRDRYREYLGELTADDPDRIDLALALTQWQEAMWFYWAAVSDASLIDDCERRLIQCLRPPWNRRGKAIPQPPEAVL